MSVRRTVTQSSAGLMLLAALAVAPSAAFGEGPAEAGPGPSDGGGGEQPTDCEVDAVPDVTVTPSTREVGKGLTFIGECFAPRDEGQLTVIDSENSTEQIAVAVEGDGSLTATFTPQIPGEHRYVFTLEGSGQPADGAFTVAGPEPTDPPTTPAPNPDPGEPTDPVEPTPGEDDGDQGDDGWGSGDDEGNTGDGSGTDDSEEQYPGNGDEGDDSNDGDDQGPDRDQGNDRDSGDDSQQEDSSEDGETSASDSNQDSASQDPAPQPPAAPGSATNDFPAATPEPSADQKQSAALAALMTSLFANGVSSGAVGTSPDEARTVIDPSADASEIEVPADGASDAGGSSGDGADSGAPDDDGLAATGSTMLVPAGIAGLAILVGAGLKIHQLRRDR